MAVKNTQDKERIYHNAFPLLDPVITSIREAISHGWETGTVYGLSAFPRAWFWVRDIRSLYDIMIHELIDYIDDTPTLPLPITPDNCHLHRIDNTTHAIAQANRRAGKNRRGFVPGIWGRRTKSAHCPTTRLLRLDMDRGTIGDRNTILSSMDARGYSYIWTPSYSAKPGCAKCHILVYGDTAVPSDQLADRYEHIVDSLIGQRFAACCDKAQGPFTQLTFLTAIRRTIADPTFAPGMHIGTASWTHLITADGALHPTMTGTTFSRQENTSYDRRVKWTEEMHAVMGAWPYPVPACRILALNRNNLSLISCSRLAVSGWSNERKRMFMRALADNMIQCEPTTSHTYAWLEKFLRSIDPFYS